MALIASFRRASVAVRQQEKQECLSLVVPATASPEDGAKRDEQRGYTSQAMFRAEGTPKPSLRIPAFTAGRCPAKGLSAPDPGRKGVPPCGILPKGRRPLE